MFIQLIKSENQQLKREKDELLEANMASSDSVSEVSVCLYTMTCVITCIFLLLLHMYVTIHVHTIVMHTAARIVLNCSSYFLLDLFAKACQEGVGVKD